MPKRVLLTRHAEKPSDEADPRLSPAGKQRAKKLAKYIPNKFGKIDFLFASPRSHESVRPIATITPLSDAIHVEINADFRDHDYAESAYHLLTDPKYRGKTAGLLASRVSASTCRGARCRGPEVSTPWNDTVFNLIWQLDYETGNSTPTLTTITEFF